MIINKAGLLFFSCVDYNSSLGNFFLFKANEIVKKSQMYQK